MTRLASVFLSSALLAAAGTYSGVITDSMCVSNHKPMNMGSDPDCVRGCAKSGSQYVLADGKNVYKLSDQQTPEKFAARRVKITGTLYEKTGIIKVDKIEPVLH